MPQVRSGGTLVCMDADNEGLADPPNGYKYMPCRHCDKPMIVGVTRRKLPHHPECGLERASAAMLQMANKSGPYYDRWLESLAKRFSDQAGGGGPGPASPGV